MAATTDYTKVFQDMMSAFPVDTSAFNDVFKSQAAFNEKFTRVALDAAERSTDISSKWAKDTISQLSDMARVKAEPADYTKAVNDFASSTAELAAENMAAFAEVAKKVQMETVELMLAAGKEASENATAAVKKATTEVTTAAKKTAAASK